MDLDPGRIERHLFALGAAPGRPVTVVAETASTNDDARKAAASGAPHGAVFLADAQTRGRGRGDHTWHSPPGENLYLSMVLRPSLAAAEVAPITLAVGVAVLRVVRRALDGRAPAALKWPNDVFVARKKIAGVLVEGQLRGDRVASLVAGVGLNVRARSFPSELAETATSLALAGVEELERSALAASLIVEIERAAALYEGARLAPMLDELRASDLLLGRAVSIEGVRGVAAGIDASGRLLVRGADGAVRRVASGEVRLE